MHLANKKSQDDMLKNALLYLFIVNLDLEIEARILSQENMRIAHYKHMFVRRPCV